MPASAGDKREVSSMESKKVDLDKVTQDVLKMIDSYGFRQEGAYNLRLKRHGGMPRRQPSYQYRKERG